MPFYFLFLLLLLLFLHSILYVFLNWSIFANWLVWLDQKGTKERRRLSGPTRLRRAAECNSFTHGTPRPPRAFPAVPSTSCSTHPPPPVTTTHRAKQQYTHTLHFYIWEGKAQPVATALRWMNEWTDGRRLNFTTHIFRSSSSCIYTHLSSNKYIIALTLYVWGGGYFSFFNLQNVETFSSSCHTIWRHLCVCVCVWQGGLGTCTRTQHTQFYNEQKMLKETCLID